MSRKRMMTRWACVLVVGLLSSCSGPENQVLVPIEAEFEDFFVLDDTVQLDSAVLIGTVWSLHVNSGGELLVLDRQDVSIHVFSSNGTLLRTLTITDCNPEATFGFRGYARFLDDSRVIALTTKGAMVFDDQGECLQTSQDRRFVTSAYSVCQRDDTLFVMPDVGEDSVFIRAYGPELAQTDLFPLPNPRFPLRARTMNAEQGLTMKCFADDVWWIYNEGHDAVPRLEREGLRRYRPAFYRERTEDWSELPLVTATNFREVTAMIAEMEQDASSIAAFFKLDESTRMVEYTGLDTSEERRGILVASHADQFEAVSALIPVSFAAAGHGYAYVVETPDEDRGDAPTNPLIVRYRFVPPMD
ncbi:MAG: hypothetical protein OXI38_04555 [Bacteroidota bacterium]|nr:hypothetical protein [Bacteroidota bacterium]